MTRIPKKYVSLHNHTSFSPYDGLGYPDDHINWCIENGLDGYAITEHGNFNSYAHAQLYVEKLNASGKNFKYIPGIEAYFHPDLAQWKKDKELAEEAATNKRTAKKLQKEQEKLQTKIVAKVDESDEIEEIEMTNALTIENEEETKSNKFFNPVNRRHHLVLLPKNQAGLLSLFAASSKAYFEGYYRFPRMDLRMLREAAKDRNIIASSACLGGIPSWSVFQELQQIKFENLDQALLDDNQLFERCLVAVGNTYDMMVDVLGVENYYLELQFNKLPAQNLVNRAIIEFAKRNGVTQQLIVTGDAHYYRPELWKERELYKKLGFMNYKAYSPDSLPKSRDDLKCELYPKNAEQTWEEYKRSKVGTSFYDDNLIADAIERTHDIAHSVIGSVEPDRTPKFPTKKLIPQDTTSFKHLVEICKEGMRKRGLADNEEYVERLREELGVIRVMKNADYFVSYQKIMELARRVCLTGPARGSAGGCLVAYVLYITDLDPIKWKLPFSRFLSVYRKGAPDIDCVHEDHYVKMHDMSFKRIGDVVVGDKVVGGDGQSHAVLATHSRHLRYSERPLSIVVKSRAGVYGSLNVVPNHKFVLEDHTVVYAKDVKVNDVLMSSAGVVVLDVVDCCYDVTKQYVDITVDDDHRFHVVPFNIIERDNGAYELCNSYT